jgi:sugar lactone lactonase YvrE
VRNRDKCKQSVITSGGWEKFAQVLIILIFTCGILVFRPTRLVSAATSPRATVVYGQGGSFTTNSANNGGITATSLASPFDDVLASSGELYVCDSGNNRVLYYPAGSTTATRVYGQSGNFITNSVNSGGLSAISLNTPQGLALDSSGNLYVSDSGNNRVLYYPAGSTTATRVYGQSGSFITNSVNSGGLSATSLNAPQGLALDSTGNLYISDSGNNRILYYPAGQTTATQVYGQSGSFITGVVNNAGISASSLSSPAGLNVDVAGNLYVSDSGNNRVLYYPAGQTTATRVYGQGGSFASNTAGISASNLANPKGISVDSSGNIAVAEYSNNRLLKFQTSLSMTVQPPVSSAAKATFGTTVSLVDVGSGLVFSDFTGPVSAAIKTGSGITGATLSGTNTVLAVAGAATFSNLSIDKGGPNYYLTISSPGVGSINTIAFTIVGSLLLTYLTSPSFTFTLTGTNSPVISQHTFKVNDNTGSGGGWHMTITSTQFTSTGGKTLPTTVLAITGVTAACTAGQTCVLPANGVNAYPITVPAASTAPAAATFFSANSGSGTGDITLTATFSLTVPPGSVPGTYTSTASETLVSFNSYYTIANRNSGKVVDVFGGSSADGATIIQYVYHTGTNQQWQFVDVGGGYTKIVSRNSGKIMDVNGGSTAVGANMLQEPYTGAASQQWQFVNIGGGYSKIINRNSGLALDVTGASLYDAALLIQTTYTGATSQQWQFGPSSS